MFDIKYIKYLLFLIIGLAIGYYIVFYFGGFENKKELIRFKNQKSEIRNQIQKNDSIKSINIDKVKNDLIILKNQIKKNENKYIKYEIKIDSIYVSDSLLRDFLSKYRN